MARQEHVLSVFVASPSDVEAERDKLEDVVRELNLAWSRELGVRLDLVRWETHAYPGIGADAQEVINDQIHDDYDIFVGIMWCRYGTPTGRAGSGTAEEFDRAKARWERDPDSVKLMIYFKDEAVPPSKLDPLQLAKVGAFRESLGKEGVLYWHFQGLDKFEELVRRHLTHQVQAWLNRTVTAEVQPACEDEEESVHTIDDDDYDEEGIIDLMEMFEGRFAELSEILQRMTAATGKLGQQIQSRADRLERLPRNAQGSVNPKDAKRFIAMASSDMKTYTAQIEADLPLFRDAANDGMNSLIKFISISSDLSEDSSTLPPGQLSRVVEGLRDSLTTSRENLVTFRDTISSLPRMTTDLNRAKRGVTNALDSLLTEYSNVEALLTEAEKAIGESLSET